MDSAFSKGSDLWVLPDVEQSYWRSALEWSLNFQIAKSLNRPSAKIPSDEFNTLKSLEAEEFTVFHESKSPWTLIAVEGLLPAKWLVFSKKISKDSFAQQLDQLWVGLGKPTVRLFSSKTWTSEALKSLKSECCQMATTEVIGEP